MKAGDDKRRLLAALLVLCILLAGLLIWQLWPRPVSPLAVRAEDVAQIRLTLEAHPELPDGEVLLTAPAELTSFCALWNGVQVVPVEPYDGVDGAPTVQLAAGDRRQIEIAFCLRDGSTRVYAPIGHYLLDCAAGRYYFYTGYALTRGVEDRFRTEAAS